MINYGTQAPEDQAFKLLALDKFCMGSWTDNLLLVHSNDDNFSLLFFICFSNYMVKFWIFLALCFVIVSEFFSICSLWVFLCVLYFQSCHSIGIDYTLKEGKFSTEEEFQNNGISGYNVQKG